MDRLLLIDTYNYMHRAYHALPKTFKDQNGEATNAVYGFTSMLISALDILKPQYVVCALDDSTTPIFRSYEFEGYKSNRKMPDADFLSQIPKIEEIIDAFGIQKIVKSGFEADDVIGSLSVQAAKKGLEVVIVSNDKDILQVLDNRVRIFIPDHSKEGGAFFGPAQFREKYGFEPIHMIDYKALRGDPSDNIPGVPGVGEKTAQTLIQKYHTFENVYEHISEITPESLQRKLLEGKVSGEMSKRVATIVLDTDIKLDLQESKIRQVDRLQVVEVLKRYNFKSLIRRMGFEVEGDTKPKKRKSKKASEQDQKDAGQLAML